MSKPYPALCKDCKHSKQEERNEWNLRCHHPKVNGKDPWALSSAGLTGGGSDCCGERKGGIFYKCGMRGGLWESK